MFFLLLCLARSGLMGIDFGGETLRASILAPGQQIRILLDQDSRRYFKTTLTVIPKQNKAVKIINSSNVDSFDYSFNNENAVRKNPNTSIRYYNNYLANP